MIRNLSPPTDQSYAVADQTINAGVSALLTGSVLAIPVDKLRIGSTFKWRISLSKTAAGTLGNVFNVRLGTAGTISDAAILTFTLPTATAAIDAGEIEIVVVIRGPLGASCVAQGQLVLLHNGNTVGLATIPVVVLNVLSGTFTSTTAGLIISLSCTTAASTVLTFQQVIGKAENL